MAIIPKPKFPNVPKLPGVPQLARSPFFPASPGPVIGIALALGKLWQSIFSQVQWGIYHTTPAPFLDPETGILTIPVEGDKKPLVVPDSFGEFSYRNEWAVADFPVQEGAFASYDKVSQPYEIMLRMYKGGSKDVRKAFLDSIEAIAGTLDKYDIHTPERTYVGVNVIRYEITRRGAGGAYFLSEVDLYFREIRETAAVYSSTAVVTENARDSSAASTTNTGTVQPKPVNMTIVKGVR